MASRPVYTSTAEGFRDEKEIAGLRPMAAPKPRAPRKAANPGLRQVTNGIVCFCGERFGESQSLEFMLHLRAEYGEVLEWRARKREISRESARRVRATPEGREYMRKASRLHRERNLEKVRERSRESEQRRRGAIRELHEAGDHSRCSPDRCRQRGFRTQKELLSDLLPPVPERTVMRKALGLTQSALAAKLGISVATVCDWERGRKMPVTVEVGRRYAETLGWG